MADITDQHDQTSPNDLDEPHSVGNGNTASEGRPLKRARAAADDDDDDDEKGGRERRKIEIKFISDKSRRHITFSKRKAGIMKKVRPPALPGLPARSIPHRDASDAARARVSALNLWMLGSPIANLNCVDAGLRAVGLDWHAGPAPRRVGNRPCLHLHDPKAAASCHKSRGQEPNSGKRQTAPRS